VKLVIVHYHLRPGGIRRIIELATPHLVRAVPQPINQVVLATGQRADDEWHEHFARHLPGMSVEVRVHPSFNYLSEQRGPAGRISAHICHALNKLFANADGENCLVWAHNLGVGRNLLLALKLAAACAARAIPLLAHQHDWWFDNRWVRWPEMRRFGFRTLTAPARAVFPKGGRVVHAAINQADATVLARHFGDAVVWLPNLTEPAPPPSAARVRAARRWLGEKVSPSDAPVWLLPCRALRRKNIAEALLLTRWLRPEAWLVVTGAASSADEAAYFRALEKAAKKHQWPLRLGVLAGNESGKPSVPELLAASEAVLLTSIQEGFGLPYLEAAAAQRPLIARRLPNIAPDLRRFGFRFPQAYDDILIAPTLFDWRAEQARQKQLFYNWCATMPATVRKLVPAVPVLLSTRPRSVAFSRLTLTAQLEVLARPVRESWAACADLNPFLKTWQRRAAAGELSVTPWPRAAKSWLGGAAYARRFFAALETNSDAQVPEFSPVKVQADFIAHKLAAHNLYPLLWNTRT
jgi:glycosyltransferase involved in cell wall biosynthesis